jgi:hypothetical protein
MFTAQYFGPIFDWEKRLVYEKLMFVKSFIKLIIFDQWLKLDVKILKCDDEMQ